MPFSNLGAGFTLAPSFNKALKEDLSRYPHGNRGRTLLVAADIGGSHARQLFETYSFLVLDLDQNGDWISAQSWFRNEVMRSMRRISFKALNDKTRRRSITPFLQMGNLLDGWLVTFAVSKNRESIFEHDQVVPELAGVMQAWKPAVQERLLRVLHFSSFLMSGLCYPYQNVLWVFDEDEIASNVGQLTRLTKILAQLYSSMTEMPLGHLRCATAKSDDGTRSLEDLLAYADLAAGTVSEITTTMAGSHSNLQQTIVAPLPKLLSWKSRHICSWLAYNSSSLRRFTCLIDLKTDGPGMKVAMLRWHAMAGNITLPSNRDPAFAS